MRTRGMIMKKKKSEKYQSREKGTIELKKIESEANRTRKQRRMMLLRCPCYCCFTATVVSTLLMRCKQVIFNRTDWTATTATLRHCAQRDRRAGRKTGRKKRRCSQEGKKDTVAR